MPILPVHFVKITSTRQGSLKCIAQGHSHEKSSGSSEAPTRGTQVKSRTFYHWATQDPLPPLTKKKNNNNNNKNKTDDYYMFCKGMNSVRLPAFFSFAAIS